jgi:hypothetical protein
MAVGHEDADTAQGLQPGLRIRDEAPVGIAVTGDLVKADLWIFFRHGGAIVVVISQMDHHIRLHRINAPAHKTKSRMGIGQNQDLHTSPTTLLLHIIYYNRHFDGRQSNGEKI